MKQPTAWTRFLRWVRQRLMPDDGLDRGWGSLGDSLMELQKVLVDSDRKGN